VNKQGEFFRREKRGEERRRAVTEREETEPNREGKKKNKRENIGADIFAEKKEEQHSSCHRASS